MNEYQAQMIVKMNMAEAQRKAQQERRSKRQ